MEHVEVEAKFAAAEGEVERVRALLAAASLRISTTTHVDRYFDPPERSDERDASEWLSVRRRGGSSTLNYKRYGAEGIGHAPAAREIETEVADADAVEALLGALGFVIDVTVRKTREEHICGGHTVCIDVVDGLGTFIEVEVLADAASEGAAQDDLRSIVAALGFDLDDADRLGYPELLRRAAQRPG